MSELDRWKEASEECQSLDQLHTVLEAALLDAPDDPVIYQGLLDLSDYYRRRGYREWQIWLLDQLYQVTEKKKVAYYLARAYFELTDYPSAYTWLDLAQVDKPVFLIDWLKAQLLFEMGQWADCQQTLQDLIQHYPTQSEPYQLLAQLKTEEGDYQRARDYYQVLLDYFADKVDCALIRRRLLALALEEEVIQLETIEALRQVGGIPLNQADDWYLLAMAYQKAGQLELASQAAQEALTREPESLEINLLLAELLADLDHIEALRLRLDWLYQVVPADESIMADLLDLLMRGQYMTPDIKDKLLDYYLLVEDEDIAYQLVTYLIEWVARHEGAQPALDLLETLAPDFPDSDYLSRFYASLYAQLGFNQEASQAYREALNLLVVDEAFLEEARQYFSHQGQVEDLQLVDQVEAYRRRLVEDPLEDIQD